MYYFFFQAEDGIRDLVRSRGLGDVYKRQAYLFAESYPNFDIDFKVLSTLKPNEFLSLIHI